MYKIITGTITKIKRSAPYPFTTADGRVWMAKIKITYPEVEETGEIEEVVYKAYPLKGTPYEDAAEVFHKGDVVQAQVHSKASEYRGDIVWIHLFN